MKKIIIGCICFIIILSVGIYIVKSINDKQDNKVSEEVLLEIKREDVKSLIREEETCWVYVGRPSCPDCVKIFPKLKSFLEDEGKSIFYYNTECKASEKKKERAYYNSLGVMSVPSIIKIEKGSVKNIYNIDNDDSYLKFKNEIMG